MKENESSIEQVAKGVADVAEGVSLTASVAAPALAAASGVVGGGYLAAGLGVASATAGLISGPIGAAVVVGAVIAAKTVEYGVKAYRESQKQPEKTYTPPVVIKEEKTRSIDIEKTLGLEDKKAVEKIGYALKESGMMGSMEYGSLGNLKAPNTPAIGAAVAVKGG